MFNKLISSAILFLVFAQGALSVPQGPVKLYCECSISHAPFTMTELLRIGGDDVSLILRINYPTS
jgi:hypothetical protein